MVSGLETIGEFVLPKSPEKRIDLLLDFTITHPAPIIWPALTKENEKSSVTFISLLNGTVLKYLNVAIASFWVYNGFGNKCLEYLCFLAYFVSSSCKKPESGRRILHKS